MSLSRKSNTIEIPGKKNDRTDINCIRMYLNKGELISIGLIAFDYNYHGKGKWKNRPSLTWKYIKV